jgi:hypothetical protein
MLSFFNFMNTHVFSARRLMKPLTSPYYIEPTVLKHSRVLGAGIIVGAIASILLLKGVDDFVFFPIYSDAFSQQTAMILARDTHAFLLFGNALCIGVGAMLLYFPQKLVAIGRYTDKWLTFRQQTRVLHEPVIDVDKWVMKNSTIAGVTLSVFSLCLGIWMYMRL